MINIILLLIIIFIIELLRQRRLDFRYSLPVLISLMLAYLVDKQVGNIYINLFIICGVSAVIYSFCYLTAYKKKLVRLVQEKAILKYYQERR